MRAQGVYLTLAAALPVALGCTNFLVTKSASADGTNIITYAADSHTLYGALYHYPAGRHGPSTWRKVVDWDSGVYLGLIPEAPVTYNVVGNVNEHGLAITETTFGGLSQLSSQEGAIIDYGSLIYIALQRSRSAREAIKTMTELVEEYGYASEGESFSLADKDEVWIMEMIGKGHGEKGAVWVAVRVPDGYVSSHANQARIRTFARDSPDVLYAPDVVDFARSKGLFPSDALDESFSFSDVYNPVNFETARGCEGRVWDFFRRVGAPVDDYLDYVSGANLSHRMPLWVKPSGPIETAAVMSAMRSHYEDTPLDFRADVGAQGFGLPYRWRPLTWTTSSGRTYFNERSVGTQQTGFTLVAQIRADMPAPLSALMHFGVDDTASTVYTPVYGGMTSIPPSYAVGDIMRFSFQSAFWVFNLVSNWAYTRYDLIHPEVQQRVQPREEKHRDLVKDLDALAMDLWQDGKTAEAIDAVTQACVTNAESLVSEWLELFQQLFVKYMDGNVKTASQDPSHPMPHVDQPGYPQPWLDVVAEQTGERYAVPEHGGGRLKQHAGRGGGQPFKAKGM